jgi:dolichol kinase
MAKVKEKIVNDTKKTIKNTKKKIIETHKKINAIEYDAHWYRRVFHAFGACFLFYYILPEGVDWIDFLKFWVPPIIVAFAIILEVLRIKGLVSSDHFFGLRMYEKNRVGSYVFFGVGILILLWRFPQFIAIPCILCACIADPVIGEMRYRFGVKHVYIFGFILCFFFFMISWYNAGLLLMITGSTVGALGAIIGETKKFWWLDDDFMIQILPAILLLIIWYVALNMGLTLPGDIIIPAEVPSWL